MALELKLARPDRIYRPLDVLNGCIILKTPSTISHLGVRVAIVGTVTLQPSVRSVGMLEALYTSIKPIQIMCKSVQISSPGKLSPGNHEILFNIAFDVPKGGSFNTVYETYHGACINIQYLLTAKILRGYMQKNLSTTVEFIVEHEKGKVPRCQFGQADWTHFYITQDTQKHSLLPSIRSGGFCITGRVITSCYLSEPVVGELVVESSSVPISSIDLNVLRIESILLNGRTSSGTTEVQTTQVADGDVCHGLPLAIYVLLPRLLTCPSVSSGTFSLEFAMCITVAFEAKIAEFYPPSDSTSEREWVAKETLPLRLAR